MRPDDRLDLTIRWVLRESVGRAAPPPGAWERISDRLENEGGMDKMTWRARLRLFGEAVALSLLGSPSKARPDLPYYGLAPGDAWRSECFHLADQHDILLGRLAVLRS